ncbi:helix-turn-helix domain-containing protein [Nibricoccus sp. IMCC34717]|uniref:helix-turn-helix domain-containing protein n=1 Tax=Nibricoccus sp. IMCC34717 TaxID=3034021 RepID=UPI00384FF6B9
MVIKSLKELKAAKARVEKLEAEVAQALEERLSGLPDELGFDSIEELIAGLRSVSAKPAAKKAGRKAKAPKAKAKAKAPKAEGKGKRGRRARITPEMKEQVKTLVNEGKSGAEIAKALKISLPSVQNIKKAFGLVKARPAAAAAS